MTLRKQLDEWYSKGDIKVLSPKELSEYQKKGLHFAIVENYIFLFPSIYHKTLFDLDMEIEGSNDLERSQYYHMNINPNGDIDVYRKQAVKGKKGFQSKKNPKKVQMRVTKEEKDKILEIRGDTGNISFYGISEKTMKRLEAFMSHGILTSSDIMIQLPVFSTDKLLTMFLDITEQKILEEPSVLHKYGYSPF